MISIDTTFRTLALCAAVPGNRAASDQLRHETGALTSWSPLLSYAEAEGLDPLLRGHLTAAGVAIPPDAAERLMVRWMQHAHAATVRSEVVAGVLAAMERDGIRPLLLKGFALAYAVYTDPVLRPMRDVDLLVRAGELRRAVQILSACGFAPAGPPVPRGHHHARAMSKIVDGAIVTMELHDRLLQSTPFLRQSRYDDLVTNARACRSRHRDVLVPGHEDLMWHVYAHAFATNVTRPSIRLLAIADLVALTERCLDEIDWERLRATYGRLWRALPFLHAVTPWSPLVLQKLGWDSRGTPALRRVVPRTPGSVQGWRDVAWPPAWCLGTRYGARRRLHRAWCRVVRHPASLIGSLLQSAGRRSSA